MFIMAVLDREINDIVQLVEGICKLYGCKIDYENSDLYNRYISIMGGTDKQQIDCAETIDRLFNCE